MIMENKKQIIASVIVILLPMIVGLCLWQRLPEQMPTHWNFSGEINGYSSKVFAVVGVGGFLLVVHLLCVFATAMDPKNKNINGKMMNIIYWICPIISVLVYSCMYAVALGVEVRVEMWIILFIGVLFVILGNWLPKCKSNYTVGIKIPWTLHSEDNWNKTHRMAGHLWMAGGFVTMASAFLGKTGEIIFLVVVALLIVIPMGYSYSLYRKDGDK